MQTVWTAMISYLCNIGYPDEGDTRPRSNVMVEGLSIDCLFDSGSSVTLISWATFLKLKKPGMTLSHNDSELKTASGENLTVRGQINLEYKFGNRKCVRPTIVVEGLYNKAIIGNDTMRTEGFILDPARKSIRIVPPSKDSSFAILAKRSYTIESGSEQIIECIFNTDKDIKDMDILTSEGFSDPILKQNLEMVEMLTRGTQRRTGNILISNHSDKPVVIPRKAQIGHGISSGGHEMVGIEETSEIIEERSNVIKRKSLVTANDVDLSRIPVEWKGKYLNVLNRFSRYICLAIR